MFANIPKQNYYQVVQNICA